MSETKTNRIPQKKSDSPLERLANGLFKENPTFVLMLGMCPTLAVTTSAINGLGMGLATTAVLMMSNLFISILRKVIPNRVRIPAFIVIIATFVTAVQLLLEAYLPALNNALGMYIPLIVVNCIILGRAESYAYSNPPILSFFDGLGMGLGFSLALTCIGAVRELLGTGYVFDFRVMPEAYVPINIFVLAPGAFFVLACLSALQNAVRIKLKKAGKENRVIQSGCSEDCMACSDTGCARRFYDAENKHETKTNLKSEQKTETKSDLKAEKNNDTKTDPKAEKNNETKSDPKAETNSETEMHAREGKITEISIGKDMEKHTELEDTKTGLTDISEELESKEVSRLQKEKGGEE